MEAKHLDKIKIHYKEYNEIIKPLIALYEVREQQLVTPMLNEIRAFNDHIARCYLPNVSADFIEKQLKSAERHIKRLILDLYKYNIVSLSDQLQKFERKIRYVDLSIIDNGKFSAEYMKLTQQAISVTRKAKYIESDSGDDNIYKAFQESFNTYASLDDLITKNASKINWAKRKSFFRRNSVIISTVVLSAIISSFVTELSESNIFDWIIDLLRKE